MYIMCIMDYVKDAASKLLKCFVFLNWVDACEFFERRLAKVIDRSPE